MMSKSVNQSGDENAGSKNDGNDLMVVSDECLVNILKYLPTADLIEVIEKDNRLISVGRQAFDEQQIFNRKPIHITNEFDPIHEEISSSVKTLKYFGCVIDTLFIKYLDEYRQFDHIIDDAIVEYCHKSLLSIVFENSTQYTMFKINKPFEKVNRICLLDGEVFAPASDIAKWFPNATELIFLGAFLADLPSSFPNHCSNLNIFDICAVKLLNNNPKYLNQIAKFIALNPQLEELKITEQDHDNTLLNLINKENGKFPNHLEISCSPGSEGEKFVWHCETLDKLKITNPGNKIRISVDQTEQLILEGIVVTNHWLKSIEKNERAEVIRLHGTWANDEIANKFVEMVKISTKLRVLMCPTLSVDQIVRLATRFEGLEQFYVGGSEENKSQMENALELIKAATDDEWCLGFYDEENPLVLDCLCHQNYYGFERV